MSVYTVTSLPMSGGSGCPVWPTRHVSPLTARRYVGGCSAVQCSRSTHALRNVYRVPAAVHIADRPAGLPACCPVSVPNRAFLGNSCPPGDYRLVLPWRVSSVERKELSEDRSGKHPCRETRSMSILRPWLLILHAAARYCACAVEGRRRNHACTLASPAQ